MSYVRSNSIFRNHWVSKTYCGPARKGSSANKTIDNRRDQGVEVKRLFVKSPPSTLSDSPLNISHLPPRLLIRRSLGKQRHLPLSLTWWKIFLVFRKTQYNYLAFTVVPGSAIYLPQLVPSQFTQNNLSLRSPLMWCNLSLQTKCAVLLLLRYIRRTVQTQYWFPRIYVVTRI